MSVIPASTDLGLSSQQIHFENSSCIIVWLDTDLNNDAMASMQQFHYAQDILRFFSDCDLCLDYLTDTDNGESKIFLVISANLIEHALSTFHELSQIDSIYIFGSYEKWEGEHWFKNWRKVKGIYTDIELLFSKLKRRMRTTVFTYDDCNEFTTLSSIDDSNKNERQKATFMYSRLLYFIFSEMEVIEGEREEFISLCHADNANNSVWINEFQRNYDFHRAIWWYTRATHLYAMLNQAFRTQNTHILIIMNFFIRDLYLRLSELHAQASLPNTMTLYRGQNMKRNDFDRQLKNNVGGLLLISTFWSTSRDRNVVNIFLEHDPEKVSVVFEMSIDTAIETHKCPFADIHAESAIGDEDEVLFSVGTVFRIAEVVYIDHDDIWKVSLTMTADTDEQLHVLTNEMIDQISGSTGYHRLGKLMCIMGKWDEAFKIYETLLGKTSDGNRGQLSHIYHQLGYVCDKKAALTLALDYYQQALTYLPSNDTIAAGIYNNIGIIYYQRNDFDQAFHNFQRSLDIEKRSTCPDQLKIAIRLSNIGGILKEKGQFKAALANFEEAVDIQCRRLSPIHPHLAILYNNIGTIHFAMQNYSNALIYQQKTLDIQQLSLSLHHPDLAPVHCNIASSLEKLHRYDEAISHVRQAIDILLHTFEPDHPDILGVQRGLEKLLSKKKARSMKKK